MHIASHTSMQVKHFITCCKYSGKPGRKCPAYAACTSMTHVCTHWLSAHMLQPAIFKALLVTCCSCTSLINHCTHVQAGCHTLTCTVLFTDSIASGAKEPAVQLALLLGCHSYVCCNGRRAALEAVTCNLQATVKCCALQMDMTFYQV